MKNGLLIISVLVLTTYAFAEIIHVPADQSTIQAGLNAASEGDTVLVVAGIYYENITWPATNGIKLIGEDRETTIIDGNQQESVIRFEDDLDGIIDTTTLISNFTITNGSASDGGGIYCGSSSSPSLENVTITDNSAEYYAGGIYCGSSSSPSLANVTISNNSAGGGGGISCDYNSSPSLVDVTISGNSAEYGDGGGIYCYSSSPSLENVTITGNSAEWSGGGIYCEDDSSPSLLNVTLSNNSAYSGGGISCSTSSNPSLEHVTITDNSASDDGGGIYCYYSSPSLANVTITDNSASDDGGGIYCYYSSPSLENVTISNNSASYGGGISCEDSSPSLVNCILWNDAPQEVYFSQWSGQNSIMIAYSDIQGGEAGIVTNNNGTVYWEEGNIDLDPLFVDEGNGDYILQEGSPCIDAGTAFFVFEGDTLVDMSEDEYVGDAPDMGAFEYGASVGVDDDFSDVPEDFSLFQNYPNPFNPVTTISYQLPKTGVVRLSIYNIKGQLVETLVNEQRSPGSYSATWYANDVSSGLYFYKLTTGNKIVTKKMLLLK